MPVKHDYAHACVDIKSGPLHHAFMENVRKLRLARNLTQAQLAELAGVNQATVSKAERGEMNITMDKIVSLAAALHVEPVELFTLPELQARALAAISAIDPERRDAALIVLEAMARK
jgi:transcriptional regulator with XRE-family HTH domain